MKTAVADTSVQAYAEHKATGHVTSSQQAILDAMRHGRDYSLSELSSMTGIEKSSVSVRINELLASGKVVISCIRACKVTGKTVRATKRSVQ